MRTTGPRPISLKMSSVGTLVAGSTVLWLFIYLVLCRIFSTRSTEWNCRLITLLHGSIIAMLSGYVSFIAGPSPFTHPGGPNTELQVSTLSLCLGYFLFDIVWCLLYSIQSRVIIAHHIISICGLTISLALGVCATETNIVVFVTEITNPILQLRWFLRQEGRYDGATIGVLLDMVFVLLFICMRIGLGTMLLFSIIPSRRSLLLVKIGGVGIYVISWLFLIDILKFVFRKYIKKQTLTE
ncbi:unnamed protein product [Lampetra planeri]